jgi:hypothetical protein
VIKYPSEARLQKCKKNGLNDRGNQSALPAPKTYPPHKRQIIIRIFIERIFL